MMMPHLRNVNIVLLNDVSVAVHPSHRPNNTQRTAKLLSIQKEEEIRRKPVGFVFYQIRLWMKVTYNCQINISYVQQMKPKGKKNKIKQLIHDRCMLHASRLELIQNRSQLPPTRTTTAEPKRTMTMTMISPAQLQSETIGIAASQNVNCAAKMQCCNLCAVCVLVRNTFVFDELC